MEQLPRKEPRVRQSIAFRAGQLMAIREQAEREKHGNVSLIVQRAIDRELEILESARTQAEREELAVPA